VARDRELWVKSLWENAEDESLRSSKLRESKNESRRSVGGHLSADRSRGDLGVDLGSS
jgi:hypothetical protein